MGRRPASVALPPEPGRGTCWMRPVFRSLTRALPSGSTATDHAMSTLPSRVTGGAESATGGRAVVVALAVAVPEPEPVPDAVAGLRVAVLCVAVLCVAVLCVVGVCVVTIPAPVPVGPAAGSPVEQAAPTMETATPTTRARPNDRDGCGIPHCVPRDEGTAVGQPPRRERVSTSPTWTSGWTTSASTTRRA